MSIHRQEDDMSSTLRIPKAEITGVYGYVVKRFSRKLFGDVPEPAEVMWHNRPVLSTAMGFGRKAQVGPGRPQPEVARAHGGRGDGRLLVVP
jgi:hypothetical protein